MCLSYLIMPRILCLYVDSTPCQVGLHCNVHSKCVVDPLIPDKPHCVCNEGFIKTDNGQCVGKLPDWKKLNNTLFVLMIRRKQLNGQFTDKFILTPNFALGLTYGSSYRLPEIFWRGILRYCCCHRSKLLISFGFQTHQGKFPDILKTLEDSTATSSCNQT